MKIRHFLALTSISVVISQATHAEIYVAAGDLQIHSAPSDDAAIVGNIRHLSDWLKADESKIKVAPAGWVPLSVDRTRNPPTPQGWVKRAQIFSPKDFRQVIGCWPVRRSEPTSGESPVQIVFTPKGAAVMYPLIYSHPAKHSVRAHVFMAGNVVYVKADGWRKNTTGFLGDGHWALPYFYDAGPGSLTPQEWDADTIQYSPRDLKGCNVINLKR